MMNLHFNHVEGKWQVCRDSPFDWLEYNINNNNGQVPQEAQQEVKKAHHQIYGSKQWIQPLTMAASVASQYEGIRNLLVPASQKN
jgi:hypothetical protein